MQTATESCSVPTALTSAGTRGRLFDYNVVGTGVQVWVTSHTSALHLLLVWHWKGPCHILSHVFKCVFQGTIRCQERSFKRWNNISYTEEECVTGKILDGPWTCILEHVFTHDGSEPECTCVLVTVDPPLRFLSKMCLLLWNMWVCFLALSCSRGVRSGVAQLEVR